MRVLPGGNRDDADASHDEREFARLVAGMGDLAPTSRSEARVLRSSRPPRSPSVRNLSITLALLAVLVGGKALWPTASGWVDYLVNGDPRFRTGVDAAPAQPPKGGRIRPAVAVPDDPGPGHYGFMMTQPNGEPVTFDPCQPIHYVIHDPAGLGDAGRDVVADATIAMSEASGLAFVFDGYTDEKPNPGRAMSIPQYSARFAPVLVSWSDPTETPRLAGGVVGLGGPLAFGRKGGNRSYVTGAIELDTPALGPRLDTASGRAMARAVVLHELGHVIGAQHAEDRSELMHASSGQQELGAGDRYVFARLGNGPCMR